MRRRSAGIEAAGMSTERKLTVGQTDMLASKILAHCRRSGIVDAGHAAAADPCEGPEWWEVLHKLRERLYATFEVPATSLTPLAARVLFGLAALHRPRRLAVCGCYAGNLMAWAAGDGFGPFARYSGDRALGIDVDSGAITLADGNFARAGFSPGTRAVVGDAFDAERFATDSPWDFLLIDIDVPGARKSGYARVVQGWLPYLAPDAIVVAHDVSHPVFAWDLRYYRDFVLAHGAASSTTLPIDQCGFEVSRWPRDDPPCAADTDTGRLPRAPNA
jgi:predicted O-methyltransferase YrrM